MAATDCTDDETMAYLLDRSTIVLLAAKGKYGKNYVSSLDITHLGRGTGVFIERNGHGYVATNEHVTRPRVRGPAAVPVSVAVALGRGKLAAEDHTHFVPSARTFEDDGNGNAKVDRENRPIPADCTSGFDLALIAMSATSYERAKNEGKQFTPWLRSSPPLKKGDKVCFRGYCAGDVDLIASHPPQIVGDGYTLFSDVVDVTGTRVTVDATESRVCYGKGTVNPKRDLHGISGAGLFDMTGALRAIVWGGQPDNKLIYACPVDGLGPLFEELDSQRG